jgi:hypothetical protein
MPDFWGRDSFEGLYASIRDRQAYDSSLRIQTLVDRFSGISFGGAGAVFCVRDGSQKKKTRGSGQHKHLDGLHLNLLETGVVTSNGSTDL